MARSKLAKDGFYDVAMHGKPKTVELYGQKADHKTVAEIIRNRKDYDETKPVRLLSCSTGKADKNGDCFAQRLADELGVTIHAPDDKIWVWPDGKMSIGPNEHISSGNMKEFKPRSNETNR